MTEKDGPRKDISLSDKKSTAETCAHLEEELQGLEGFEKAINKQTLEVTPLGKKRSRKTRIGTPVVKTLVKRSSRVKASNNGYKPNVSEELLGLLICSSNPIYIYSEKDWNGTVPIGAQKTRRVGAFEEEDSRACGEEAKEGPKQGE